MEVKEVKKRYLWYGEFDPLQETVRLVFPCNYCGSLPIILRTQKKDRWQLLCPKCGNKAEGSKHKWQAIINWNKAPVSQLPYWREFPLFDLDRFQTPEDAREYLKKVRQVLENRLKVCKQNFLAYRKGIFPKPPGRKYQERLKAFLQWCILAQGVCKYWIYSKNRKK